MQLSRTPRLLFLGSLLIDVLFGWTSTRADFNELFRRIPAESNVLVVVKVDEILRTPLAISENWAANRRTSTGEVGLLIPPDAKEIVIASQLDLERNLPRWEAGVMTLDPPPSFENAAQSVGRPIEQLAGTPAFRSPRDAYVVQFSKNIVGAMWPANYQQASHWCQSVQGQRTVALSPYLQQTVQYAQSDKAHVMMSIDLTNAVPPHILRERLSASPTVTEAGLDHDAVTELFSGIAGATLRLNVSDRIAGQLRVDFDEDAALLKDIAKPLLLEILARHGAAIDEFAAMGTTDGADGHRAVRRIIPRFDRAVAEFRSVARHATGGVGHAGCRRSHGRLAARAGPKFGNRDGVTGVLSEGRKEPGPAAIATRGQDHGTDCHVDRKHGAADRPHAAAEGRRRPAGLRCSGGVQACDKCRWPSREPTFKPVPARRSITGPATTGEAISAAELLL